MRENGRRSKVLAAHPGVKEDHVDTYIIRIYQRDASDRKKIAGVVEGIGKEGKRAFLSPESLWRILTMPWRESRSEGEPSSGTRRGKVPMTLTDIMTEIAEEEK